MATVAVSSFVSSQRTVFSEDIAWSSTLSKRGVLVLVVWLSHGWFSRGFLCSFFTQQGEVFTEEFDIFLDFGHTLVLVVMIGESSG